MAVSKRKFKAYEVVKESGTTNMFNIKKVIELSDKICKVPLTKKDCFQIMGNYGKLKEKHNEKICKKLAK